MTDPATMGDAGSGFVVELEQFQGPLDLLLHLIREQDIDIFDIPIARITEQFLKAIEGVEVLGLDRAGEFLEMASTLLRIKVQMLLPRHAAEEGELEDPRAELVQRLLEYEHFRDAARLLESSESDRARHFGRGYVPPRPGPDPADAPLEVDWSDLWAAVLELLERHVSPSDHLVATRTVALEEKVALILETLARRSRVEFGQLVRPYGDRLHGVVTLLAGLELARRHELGLRQSELFAPLWLYKDLKSGAKGTDAGDADH
ncbi:MAG: segregation/condensation protein A [Gemmatimonadota bacterium]|jgi:segregation and condensation protein A